MNVLEIIGALVLWVAGLYAAFVIPLLVGYAIKPLDMQGAFAGGTIGFYLAIAYVISWAIYFIAT